MTQADLDALPESGLRFGQRTETRPDGSRVNIPVADADTYCGPLFQGPDDIMFVRDANGDAWTTGWHDGVLYKRRLRNL